MRIEKIPLIKITVFFSPQTTGSVFAEAFWSPSISSKSFKISLPR